MQLNSKFIAKFIKMAKASVMFFLFLQTFFVQVRSSLADNIPKDWQFGLMTPKSIVAREIYDFYNDILLYVCYGISIIVLLLLMYVIIRFREKKNPIPSKTTHNVKLEIVWTIVPVLILAAIFIPSIKLIKLSDTVPASELTIKVTGSQWYWSYEYPDHEELSFQSILVGEEEARETGQIRLMDVDNPLVLPINKNIRIIVTASDVLHSFGVNSLGFKIDAVPGRLNEIWVNIDEVGNYYGFCYELCGAGHSSMPIKIVAVSESDFNQWLSEKSKELASSQ